MDNIISIVNDNHSTPARVYMYYKGTEIEVVDEKDPKFENMVIIVRKDDGKKVLVVDDFRMTIFLDNIIRDAK